MTLYMAHHGIFIILTIQIKKNIRKMDLLESHQICHKKDTKQKLNMFLNMDMKDLNLDLIMTQLRKFIPDHGMMNILIIQILMNIQLMAQLESLGKN